ncbi:HicB-like antitoxin [Mycobacterium Phage Nergal]|nr:HicB-like antitoxin [Mycobacterium Phage Nergal]
MLTMTEYTAQVGKGDTMLAIYVPEVDRWTQAETEADVVPMATDLISLMLDVPASEVAVRVEHVVHPRD